MKKFSLAIYQTKVQILTKKLSHLLPNRIYISQTEVSQSQRENTFGKLEKKTCNLILL